MLHSAPASEFAGESIDVEALTQLLRGKSDLTPAGLQLMRRAASKQYSATLRQEISALMSAGSDSDSTLVKIGVGWYLLGAHQDAYNALCNINRNGLASLYLGYVCLALENYPEAVTHFAEAAKNGADQIEATLQQVGAIRLTGNIDAAQELLRSIAGQAVSKADYSFQMGCILADQGDTLGAIEYFERAVDMDPHHTRALFWLANESFRLGDDDDAIVLYERALSKPPYHLGALLNLGILYEDNERYAQAAFCFRRVLESDPTNSRAKLFLKDIDASEDQFYDEDSAREEAKLKQTLSRPITDFELSVRSRNCLVQLGINTIGDLTEISEPELLASRNFGETSLKEIQELLTQHNLRIGQNLETKKPDSYVPTSDMSQEQRAALERPIGDLALSVRARKCMQRLNITTIGELITKTPDELLGSKNFGVTSLNEIRVKLAEVDLSLRND